MRLSVTCRPLLLLFTAVLSFSFIAQDAMATQRRRHFDRGGSHGKGGNHSSSSRVYVRKQDRKCPPTQNSGPQLNRIENHHRIYPSVLELAVLLMMVSPVAQAPAIAKR
jgi:hypothetical protein